ncbi:MAG: nucleotidyltransferase family protein [Bradyrhizobium sp.]
MRPSTLVRRHIDRVKEAISRYPVRNPRLFGSSARGDDRQDSDVDILVDPLPQTTLYDLAELEMEIESILGCRVDVRTPGELAPDVAQRVAPDLQAI